MNRPSTAIALALVFAATNTTSYSPDALFNSPIPGKRPARRVNRLRTPISSRFTQNLRERFAYQRQFALQGAFDTDPDRTSKLRHTRERLAPPLAAANAA